MSIIAVSGKINNGKDIIGEIINYHCRHAGLADKSFEEWQEALITFQPFKIKKFADKLKDTICLWLGCSRATLETREFKETPLPEMWWKYTDGIYSVPYLGGDTSMLDGYNIKVQKTTPRLLLQQLGTECGRDIIHRNIWVNSTLGEYTVKPKGKAHDLEDWSDVYNHRECQHCKNEFNGYKRQYLCKTCIDDDSIQFYPNWVITDTRFPNEVEAIVGKGISIRVTRPIKNRFPELWKEYVGKPEREIINDEEAFLNWLSKKDVDMWKKLTHESETALDNYEKFDYIIENDGTFEELIEKVKEILVLTGIL